MYTCEIRINAKLVKEGSFCINAKLVKEELILPLSTADNALSCFTLNVNIVLI